MSPMLGQTEAWAMVAWGLLVEAGLLLLLLLLSRGLAKEPNTMEPSL